MPWFLKSFVLQWILILTVSGYCPPACICKDGEEIGVECLNAGLEIVPMTLNPEIQVLVLQYNKIKEIGSASFQFHPELDTVDLSNNQLIGIQDNTFEAQKKLIKLKLEGNELKTLSNLTFVGLGNLEYLDISKNKIDHLPYGLFHSLEALQKLNLEKNEIAMVDGQTFSGLRSLKLLNLNDNALTKLPADTFNSIEHLSALNLSRNKITKWSETSFAFLSDLLQLDLSYNSLLNISKESFQDLSSLISLKLVSTNLSSVPTLALSSLGTLEELILSENKFSTIDSGAFQGLKSLHVIKIQYCRNLKTIQSGSFSDNRELTDIDISNNENLAVIDKNVFSDLPNLSDLKLEHNQLSRISLKGISLQSLLLTGNAWTCDCRLLPLQNLLMNLSSVQNRSSVRCAKPYSARGDQLLSVELEGCAEHFEEAGAGYISTTFIFVIGGTVSCISLIILILLLCRRRILELVKDIRWRKTESAIKNKEMEYQKSFIQYEEYFLSLARQQAELEQNQNIPVTEL